MVSRTVRPPDGLRRSVVVSGHVSGRSKRRRTWLRQHSKRSKQLDIMEAITENVSLFKDTCNVYVIGKGHEAVLIDFGSGDVLDELAGIRVVAVLMTHHHRD